MSRVVLTVMALLVLAAIITVTVGLINGMNALFSALGLPI